MTEEPGGLGLKLDFLKGMYHYENDKYEAALESLAQNPNAAKEAYASAAVSGVLSLVIYFLETGRTDGTYEG